MYAETETEGGMKFNMLSHQIQRNCSLPCLIIHVHGKQAFMKAHSTEKKVKLSS